MKLANFNVTVPEYQVINIVENKFTKNVCKSEADGTQKISFRKFKST